jgi:hypothetical protein
MKKIRSANRLHIIGASVLFLCATGCTQWRMTREPVLVTPIYNLAPLSTLSVPKTIETMSGCPRQRTEIEAGRWVSLRTGRATGVVRERFSVGLLVDGVPRKNTDAERKTSTDITVTITAEVKDAVEMYNVFKSLDIGVPVCVAGVTNDINYCIWYTTRSRGDPEGGSCLFDYYESQVALRVRNAFVMICISHADLSKPNITPSIQWVADLFAKYAKASEPEGGKTRHDN